MKKNKFACHKQYLLSRFTSSNAKNTPTDQIYHTTFYLFEKNDPQTFKSSSCKNPFLPRVCYW